MEKIAVKSLPITLVQLLKWGGFAQTGSEAKALVRQDMVRLNGQACNIPGKQLALGDKIEVAGQLVELCLEAE